MCAGERRVLCAGLANVSIDLCWTHQSYYAAFGFFEADMPSDFVFVTRRKPAGCVCVCVGSICTIAQVLAAVETRWAPGGMLDLSHSGEYHPFRP